MNGSIEIKVDSLFSFLLAGDECAARLLVEKSLREGDSPEGLLREVMFPLAVETEKLRQLNQIDPECYETLRKRLHRLAEEVRQVHEEIRAACGRPGQFVDITLRGAIARARVTDSVVDARRAQIVAAEIRGAVEALAGRASTLVLDFASASHLTSAALGLCMHVLESARSRDMRVIFYGLCGASARLVRQMTGRATLVAPSEDRLERLLEAA